MTKKRLLSYALIAVLIVVLAGTAAAQTGVGRQRPIYAERINLESSSSIYAPVQITQGGTAHALDVLSSLGVPLAHIGADGAIYSTGPFTTTGLLAADSFEVGGGYGSTGCTMSSAGALQCNSGLTSGGDINVAGKVKVGSTPGLLAGDGVSIDGTLNVSDTVTFAGDTYFGGGYGSTGCTLSAAGVLQCNGAFTTSSNLTVQGAVGLSQINVAGAGANPWDYTGTLAAMTSDDFTLFDINITNGNHTGANTVQAIDIAGLTQDAETTETAINVGTGWDWGMTLQDGAKIGNGFGSTGCTIGSDGVARCNGRGYFGSTIGATGAISTTGAVTADSVSVGGGYAGSGCAISNAGVLQCNGAATTDGALTADSVVIGGGYGSAGCTGSTTGTFICDSTITSVAGLVASAGDVTISPEAGGGNATDRNEFIGLPRTKLYGLGTGTNGTTETTAFIDATPTGEWAAKGANTTLTADTTYWKDVTNSLKIAFTAAAVITNGATIDITNDDWTGNESFGFWIRSSKVLAGGDLLLLVDDSSLDAKFNVCAVPTANTWTWCEIDVTSLAAGLGDVVDKLHVVQAAATVTGAYDIYLDAAYKWDFVDEDALGDDILRSGILGAVNTTTAANLAQYTDYFVNYQTGADAIVYISNQSAATVMVEYAY